MDSFIPGKIVTARKSLIDWLVRAVVVMRWKPMSIIIGRQVMIVVLLEKG
ncbi:MAG: hypothetical protein ABFS24_03445 [Pseudomonadota bacterium]